MEYNQILQNLDARKMTNMITNELFKGMMPVVPRDEADNNKWIDVPMFCGPT